MRFKVVCTVCGHTIWVRGVSESDTNATVLREDDPEWDEACEHLKAGGDYEIKDYEYDGEPDSY